MTAQVTVYVSDHAMLRYIERRYGVDVEKIRREITSKALPAAKMGAAVFGIDDLKFVLSRGDHDNVVTVKTVMERWMKPDNKGAKKNRRKDSPL